MKYKTNYDKVREFHRAFGHALDKELRPNDDSSGFALATLRCRLIEEEFEEVVDAIFNLESKKALAKEIADLLYVTYGMAATYGIDIDTVFNLVHESNMSKLGADGKPIYRNDGKVLKGPNYKEPDLDTWYDMAERVR